jgi:hypothetical protein
LDEYQDKNNAYSLDGLPGLASSRKRLGRNPMSDKVRQWFRDVWYGKLDALFAGWLIGVVIAVFHAILGRYGETIRIEISNVGQRALERFSSS